MSHTPHPTSTSRICSLPPLRYCVVRSSTLWLHHSFHRHSWWRRHIETVSALLAICVGNSTVTGGFPAQRPVTRSFDVFFDLRPNKRLSKQSRGWWFDTPSHSLWPHSNANPMLSDLVYFEWWHVINESMFKTINIKRILHNLFNFVISVVHADGLEHTGWEVGLTNSCTDSSGVIFVIVGTYSTGVIFVIVWTDTPGSDICYCVN